MISGETGALKTGATKRHDCAPDRCPVWGRIAGVFRSLQRSNQLDAPSPRPYGPRDFREGFCAAPGDLPLVTNQTGDSDDPDKRHLDDLGRRIDAVRGSQPEAKPAQPSGRLNVVYRLSTEFVAAVFVGLALGWGFDKLTGWKPVGIIGFSLLGIAAAFYAVVRAMRELDADQNKQGK